MAKLGGLILLWMVSSSYASDNFKLYQQNLAQGALGQATEFDQYKEKLEADFKQYQKIIDTAYKEERNRLQEKWKDAYLGKKNEFVWYSKDLSYRAIVNYEYEAVRVERYKGEISPVEVTNVLTDLSNLTEKTAFESNGVLNRIEKAVVKQLPESKTAILDDESKILTPIINKISKAEPEKNKTGSAVLIMADASRVKGGHVVENRLPLKAKKQSEFVSRFSKEYKISEPLVYAIMESESSFNPLAKSHIPAYGLMQIVPRSAGRDASKLVLGESKLLAPSYLFNERNNIEMGSAYLHILYYRYLKSIKDETSRLYCAIAAYNTGAGNVAKAFIGNTNINKAAKSINALNPEQVYQTLVRKLPYDETRKYLPKVRKRMEKYQL